EYNLYIRDMRLRVAVINNWFEGMKNQFLLLIQVVRKKTKNKVCIQKIQELITHNIHRNNVF
ncbi:hypothetical protein MNBD_DELTA03-1373, partial [hydrothermal vent metagenome]